MARRGEKFARSAKIRGYLARAREKIGRLNSFPIRIYVPWRVRARRAAAPGGGKGRRARARTRKESGYSGFFYDGVSTEGKIARASVAAIRVRHLRHRVWLTTPSASLSILRIEVPSAVRAKAKRFYRRGKRVSKNRSGEVAREPLIPLRPLLSPLAYKSRAKVISRRTSFTHAIRR